VQGRPCDRPSAVLQPPPIPDRNKVTRPPSSTLWPRERNDISRWTRSMVSICAANPAIGGSGKNACRRNGLCRQTISLVRPSCERNGAYLAEERGHRLRLPGGVRCENAGACGRTTAACEQRCPTFRSHISIVSIDFIHLNWPSRLTSVSRRIRRYAEQGAVTSEPSTMRATATAACESSHDQRDTPTRRNRGRGTPPMRERPLVDRAARCIDGPIRRHARSMMRR
jgi:hypothetical protein